MSDATADRIVPDGFDLERALQQESTTPDSERASCPDCGAIDLRPRTGKPFGAHRTGDDPYYCKNCQTSVSDAEVSTRGD